MIKLFTPFEEVSNKTSKAILFGWLAFLLAFWVYYGFGDTHLFPTIPQVLTGFKDLWYQGLVVHIFSSLALCFGSILLAVGISLLIVYLSPLPILRPAARWTSKLRYLPLTGLSFYISMLIHDARQMQVWILVMFMSTFLITSLLSMIDKIPEAEFNHVRTLGCSRWEVLWEVIIKGRLDYVIEAVRQNFAIMWVALVTVESILAASGGIGFLIKNSDKFMNHGRIVALQWIIFVLGTNIDFAFNLLRRSLFRYSKF